MGVFEGRHYVFLRVLVLGLFLILWVGVFCHNQILWVVVFFKSSVLWVVVLPEMFKSHEECILDDVDLQTVNQM